MKTLVFDSSNDQEWILDHLNCRTVTDELLVANSHRNPQRVNYDDFVRFFNEIEGEIGNLTLSADEIDLNKSSVVLAPKFKWKNLSFSARQVETIFNLPMSNMMKLCLASSPNATDMELRFNQGHPVVYDIIASAKSVNTLIVNYESLLRTQLPFYLLPNLDHIETLDLHSYDSNSSFGGAISRPFGSFMRKLTNLKTLKMDAIMARHFLIDGVHPLLRELKSMELDLHERDWLTQGNTFLQRQNYESAAIENLLQLELPKLDTLLITSEKDSAMCREYTQLLAAMNANKPSVRKVKIEINESAVDNMTIKAILLNAYKTMSNVQVFEVEDWSHNTLKGTRAEIYQKYFVSIESCRQTSRCFLHVLDY